jgi:hypothetical protein
MKNILVCINVDGGIEGIKLGAIYVDYEEYSKNDKLWVVKGLTDMNGFTDGTYFKSRFKEIPSTKLTRLLFE